MSGEYRPKIGDRVMAVGTVRDTLPQSVVVKFDGDGIASYHPLAALRPTPPEPDTRPFRVRRKRNGYWLWDAVCPGDPDPNRIESCGGNMTAIVADAYVYPPHWRPIFEADDQWEIVPIDPEPQPAATDDTLTWLNRQVVAGLRKWIDEFEAKLKAIEESQS